MQEIWIPEFFITLFIFFHIIRPYNKKLKAIDGLAWLPLLSLLLCLVLVPAYGFRPEAFPLFLYAVVLSGAFRRPGNKTKYRYFQETHFLLLLPPLVFLFAAAGIAFYFTPQRDTALNTRGVYARTISGTVRGAEEREYSVRVYTDDARSSQRPLLVLLPPALGSLSAVDEVSSELRDRGFTVLAFSERKGASPAEWFRRAGAFSSGTLSAKANRWGRGLEEKRKDALLFILSWIRQNPHVEEGLPLFDIASRDAVFLAGYDAGGSALVLVENFLAESFSYSQHRMKILGLIAIESPLWSLYREEEDERETLPVEAGWYESIRYGLSGWLRDLKPKKIAGLERIPEISTPLLFLVSERSLRPKYTSRSPALAFEAARGPAVLASAENTGPLDYSDFPVKYPVITALFSGGRIQHKLEAPAAAAAIITGFADDVLKAEGLLKNTPRQGANPQRTQ